MQRVDTQLAGGPPTHEDRKSKLQMLDGALQIAAGESQTLPCEGTRASGSGLRVAEKIAFGYFIYALAASFVFHLSVREHLALITLNVLACATVFALSKAGRAGASRFLASARDWLPTVLILLAYRESGLFFTPDPRHRLDQWFAGWDSVLLRSAVVLRALSLLSPWLEYYLEVCYFLCYPLVPLGLGSLLLAQRQGKPPSFVPRTRNPESQIKDRFWTTVLLAAFCCYTLYPLFPLTPPRLLFNDLPALTAPASLRRVNLWILAHYGVQASVFPSGHVAAVTASALAVRSYLPRVGAIFLMAAASITVATVVLRYHYTADALAGVLTACAAFYASNLIHKA